VLSTIALALGLCSCSTPERPSDARPNVLLITVDSLRADRLGFSGYTPAETPNMDALAARGAVFTRALTPAPEAPPALASLLTGQYPATHGLRTGESIPLPEGAVTLAEMMKSSGYTTAAFVASLLLHPRFGLNQGFDTYGASFAEVPRVNLGPDKGFVAEKVVDLALEFLQRARRQRFFLWINFYDPHYTYAPPEPFATRFSADLYNGEVSLVDRELGRILSKLRDYQIEGQTIVVLAGSNGEGLGDHGEAYHGVTLQEATTRVPLVIVAPPYAGGSRISTPVSLVDVAPTLLDLLGLPPLEGAEGASLARPAALPPEDRPLYLETRLPERLFGWKPLTGVVSGSWKYVAGTRGELYDLSSDPRESRDLSSLRPEVKVRLSELVASYAARGGGGGAAPGEEIRARIRELGYSDKAAPRPERDPRDMVSVANDALKADRTARGRQREAASFLFEGVLGQDPDNYLALLDTALLAGTERRFADRRRMLEHTQKLYPEASEVYHHLGHVATEDARTKDMVRATKLMAIAVDLDPLNAEAFYDLACFLALGGRQAEALDLLQKAVKAGFRDFEWMSLDTELDSLRSDPRFDTITEGRARKPKAEASPTKK
jgi:arylsulfatase A-like enzyme